MAETLAAVHGKEIAQLVAVRLTEILGHGTLTPWMKPTPLTLFIEIQEQGLYVVPIDHMTDCHDLFQLAIGEKGGTSGSVSTGVCDVAPRGSHKRNYQKVLLDSNSCHDS